MADITDKQMAVINDIHNELGYEFVGETRKDASDFIGKHLPRLKKYWGEIYLADSFRCDAEGGLMNQ